LLQRIEQAKIAAKVKARDTDHIRLSEKEGTVPKTACQQACPAERDCLRRYFRSRRAA
jgi:hypothetical protein